MKTKPRDFLSFNVHQNFEKKVVEQYIVRINNILKNPQKAKLAVKILENWLKKK